MAVKKIQISEDKAKKIAVGATVAGVLLILFLVVVMIIQFVQMGVKNAEQSKLAEQQAELERMIESGQLDLDYYKTKDGYYWLARTAGWQ